MFVHVIKNTTNVLAKFTAHPTGKLFPVGNRSFPTFVFLQTTAIFEAFATLATLMRQITMK